jgi:hypothetical protein
MGRERLRAVLLAVFCVVSPPLAWAEPTVSPAPAASGIVRDRVAAERLFDEGRKLLMENKVDLACEKLEASNNADPAVGTLLNLGNCNEKRDRLATAWSDFRAALSLAVTNGDRTRAEFAQKRSEAIRLRVGTLTIVALSPEPGLVVKRDGIVVEAQAWGVPLPLDAGPHLVEATSPGKEPFSKTVTLKDGDQTTVSIEPLATMSTAAPEPLDQPTSTRPQPRADAGFWRDGRKVAAVSGFGLSAVALGIGGFLALSARGTWAKASTHCDATNHCDDTGFDLNQDARRDGNMATVFLTSGTVLAVASAVVFFLLADRAQASAPPPTRALPLPRGRGYAQASTSSSTPPNPLGGRASPDASSIAR